MKETEKTMSSYLRVDFSVFFYFQTLVVVLDGLVVFGLSLVGQRQVIVGGGDTAVILALAQDSTLFVVGNGLVVTAGVEVNDTH